MKMKLSRCKLTKKNQLRLLEFFVAEVTARTASDLLGLNRNTVSLFYRKIRKIIEFKLSKESGMFDCQIEVDESYFGGVRKGKRGRGAAGKNTCFWTLKTRRKSIYTGGRRHQKQNANAHNAQENKARQPCLYRWLCVL